MKILDNSECLTGFGKFIREIRKKRGLYQADVASAVGITQAYYSYIENGEKNVDLVLAMEICKVLNVNISEFVSRYM